MKRCSVPKGTDSFSSRAEERLCPWPLMGRPSKHRSRGQSRWYQIHCRKVAVSSTSAWQPTI